MDRIGYVIIIILLRHSTCFALFSCLFCFVLFLVFHVCVFVFLFCLGEVFVNVIMIIRIKLYTELGEWSFFVMIISSSSSFFFTHDVSEFHWKRSKNKQQSNKQTNKQTSKQAIKQASKQTNKQANKRTNP